MSYAIVFPGQGSQSLGMLADLAAQFPVVEVTFALASSALGYDLWHAVQHDEIKLNQTAVTQPAMLAADIAVYRCWQSAGFGEERPVALAGHSLGEYAALVVAGSLDYIDAIKLVAKRGLFMQEAVPTGVGAMAAIIGLDEASLTVVCEEAAEDEVVMPANLNAIGQTVIAGHKSAVLRAIDLANKKGAKIAKLIPVSVPSHCSLMQTAADKLAVELQAVTFKQPEIPVLQNFDVNAHFDSASIRSALVQQMVAPVRWVETLQKFINEYSVTTCYECGPGKVLAGLIKRIDRTVAVIDVITELKENQA